jgi:hypothetical protein
MWDAQPFIASAMRELESLSDELDLADSAKPKLYVRPF